MAWFDEIPNEILLRIFSYLSIHDISLSVRNVCTRWRDISEDDEIWKDWVYSPDESTPKEEIICMLKNMPAFRKFQYFGTCNVIETLSQYCRKVNVLIIPHIKLNATLLKLTMERLTELSALHIEIRPTREGAEITRIIGKSKTLVKLILNSPGVDTVAEGLLKPIADGCPNLNSLKCGAFICPKSDTCYLMQRKKHQLVQYSHRGLVSADLIKAINECTNLKKLTFIDADIEGPRHEIPNITQLQNLTVLEVAYSIYTAVQEIPLTIFTITLPNLSYIGIKYTCGNIDHPLNEIILKCPLLTHLVLEGNYELHSNGLRNISSCKLLKYLDVSRCTQLDVSAFKYVAEGCPQLQHLDVSGIPITDGMFRQILRCRNLKTLLMRHSALRGIDLNLISTNISGLLYLNIGPYVQLRDDDISELKRTMPQLVIKQASNFYDITEYFRIKTHLIPEYF
jgi:Leucine-rich repeat (LRR) protein